jgi:prevent-host-death family protein
LTDASDSLGQITVPSVEVSPCLYVRTPCEGAAQFIANVRILGIMPKMEILRMPLTRVTASEFQHSFGALSDRARHEPVVITKHGRDSLVVMSAEEWSRLKRRDRRVGLTTELPEEWVEAVRDAKVPDEFSFLDDELK